MSIARRGNLPPGNKPQAPIFPVGAIQVNIVAARIATMSKLKSQLTTSLYAKAKGGSGMLPPSLPANTTWNTEQASDESLMDLRHGDVVFTLRSMGDTRYVTGNKKPSSVALPVFAMGHVLRVPNGMTLLGDDSDERRALDDLACTMLELNEINFEGFVHAPDSRADSGEGVTNAIRAGNITIVNNGTRDIVQGDTIKLRIARPYELGAGHAWDDSQSGYRPVIWVEAVDAKKMDVTFLPYIRFLFDNDTGIFALLAGMVMGTVLSGTPTLFNASDKTSFWKNDGLLMTTNVRGKPLFTNRYEIVWYNLLVGTAFMSVSNADIDTDGVIKKAFVKAIRRMQSHLGSDGSDPDDDGFIHGIQRGLRSFRGIIGTHGRNNVGRANSSAIPGDEFEMLIQAAGR